VFYFYIFSNKHDLFEATQFILIAFSTITLSVKGLFASFSINETQHKQHTA